MGKNTEKLLKDRRQKKTSYLCYIEFFPSKETVWKLFFSKLFFSKYLQWDWVWDYANLENISV